MIFRYMDKPWWLKGEPEKEIDEYAGMDLFLKGIKSSEPLYETNINNILASEEKPQLSLLLYGPYGSGKMTLSQMIAVDRKSMYYAVNHNSLNYSEDIEREEIISYLFEDLAHYKSTVVTYSDPEFDPESFRDFMNYYNSYCHINPQNSIYLIVCSYDIYDKEDRIVDQYQFKNRIHIPLPDIETRIQFIKIKTKTWNMPPDFPYDDIAKEMEEFNYVNMDRAIRSVYSQGLRIYWKKMGKFIHYNLLRKSMFKAPKPKIFIDEIRKEREMV